MGNIKCIMILSIVWASELHNGRSEYLSPREKSAATERRKWKGPTGYLQDETEARTTSLQHGQEPTKEQVREWRKEDFTRICDALLMRIGFTDFNFKSTISCWEIWMNVAWENVKWRSPLDPGYMPIAHHKPSYLEILWPYTNTKHGFFVCENCTQAITVSNSSNKVFSEEGENSQQITSIPTPTFWSV